MSGAPKPLTARVLAELGIRVVAPQVPGPSVPGSSGVAGPWGVPGSSGVAGPSGVAGLRAWRVFRGGDGRDARCVGQERSVTPSPASRAGSSRPPDLFDVAAADELKVGAPLAAPPASHPAGRRRGPAPSSGSWCALSRPGRGRPTELSGVLRTSWYG